MRGQSVTENGNWRNGESPNFPLYWRDNDRGYEYMLVIQRDWRLFVHQRSLSTPNGEWDSYDLSTNTEIGVIDWNDSHKSVCIAVDTDGYIHIMGNTRMQLQRYIMSENPDDITSWDTGVMADSWYAGISNGRPGYAVYNAFERMSDGTLLMGLQAREDYVVPTGSDFMMWKRLPGSGEWTDCVPGGGGHLVVSDPNETDLAYVQGFFVDENDRLHMTYAYARYPGGGGDSVRKPVCYVYSDDVGATWKTITGNNVPAPITEASEVMEDGPAILFGEDQLQMWVFGRLTTDPVTGYPMHFIRDNALSVPSTKFVFWTGTEWDYVDGSALVVNSVYALLTGVPVFTWNWGDMWLWGVRNWPFGESARRSYIGANISKGTSYIVRAGAGGAKDWDKPGADFASHGVYIPALTHAGGLEDGRRVTRIPLPDGDSPRVFEFGMGAKRKVAA